MTRKDISDTKSVFQGVQSDEGYSKLIVAPADWKKMAEQPEDATLPERAVETVSSTYIVISSYASSTSRVLSGPQIKSAGDGKGCIAFCCLGSAPYTEESDFLAPSAFAHACKKADGNVGMSLVIILGYTYQVSIDTIISIPTVISTDSGSLDFH